MQIFYNMRRITLHIFLIKNVQYNTKFPNVPKHRQTEKFLKKKNIIKKESPNYVLSKRKYDLQEVIF